MSKRILVRLRRRDAYWHHARLKTQAWESSCIDLSAFDRD